MQADAGHIHHQLLRLGFTPRRAAGILYLGSGAFGVASLLVIRGDSGHVGLIVAFFFVGTALAIDRLGYSEFAEINGALRRVVSQRRIIQNGIVCRRLADDLAEAPSIREAWSILRRAARQLGFSYVELRLRRRADADDDVPTPRYAQRLAPASESGDVRETTFAVALTGKGGTPGQVVFSRLATAQPLHSELPLLISAVAESLPQVIERDARVSLSASPAWVSSPWASSRGGFDASLGFGPADARGDVDVSEHKHSSSMICTSCGSSRVYRSHSRSFVERLRKRVTTMRLYECSACGWRGWRLPEAGMAFGPSPAAEADAPDLTALDLALQNVHTLRKQEL